MIFDGGSNTGFGPDDWFVNLPACVSRVVCAIEKASSADQEWWVALKLVEHSSETRHAWLTVKQRVADVSSNYAERSGKGRESNVSQGLV